jgi:hypothetical protein
MTWYENSGSSKNYSFPPIQKIANEFQKKYKIWFTNIFWYGD